MSLTVSPLDESKWRYRLHILGTRHDTLIEDATHLYGNSNLIFELVEKDGHFYSSQLQTGENYMDRPGKKFERYTWPIAKISKPLFQHKKGYYESWCSRVLLKCDKKICLAFKKQK